MSGTAAPKRIVLMGVSGSGKSSVGEALQRLTGLRYLDGDDLHPPTNVAKMAAGIPLDDEDRWPWLDRVAAVLATRPPVAVGCSALKRIYRDRLRAGAAGPVTFVHLSGPRELIAGRMAARTGHFMPSALLDSQFATLEPPEGEAGGLTVSIDQPTEAIAREIAARLGLPLVPQLP